LCSRRLDTLLGVSVPVFWLGLMMMLFSVELGWLPTTGRGTWQQLLMPSFALGFGVLDRVDVVDATTVNFVDPSQIPDRPPRGATTHRTRKTHGGA
jgi:hypothetical protein